MKDMSPDKSGIRFRMIKKKKEMRHEEPMLLTKVADSLSLPPPPSSGSLGTPPFGAIECLNS